VVARLLGEQLEDGGWNCETENGSVRSSFDTTIRVLEGLLAHERASGGSADSIAARRRGEDYLLERRFGPSSNQGQNRDGPLVCFYRPFVLWLGSYCCAMIAEYHSVANQVYEITCESSLFLNSRGPLHHTPLLMRRSLSTRRSFTRRLEEKMMH